MGEKLSYENAKNNGTDFNKSIQKALENGTISQEELINLSKVYKENMSGVIKINKENLEILSKTLKSNNNLKDTFNKLKKIQETIDYNPIKDYISTLKKFQDIDITTKNNSIIIKRGGTHDIIFAIQGGLLTINKKYDSKGIDGFYGKKTKAAILKFQQDYKLNYQNGIMTSESIKKIVELLEKLTKQPEDIPVETPKDTPVETSKDTSVKKTKDTPVKKPKDILIKKSKNIQVPQKDLPKDKPKQQEKLSLGKINQYNIVVWKTYEARAKITDPTILQTFEANIDNESVNNTTKVELLDTLIRYYDSVGNNKKSKELAIKCITIVDTNPGIKYNIQDYKFAKIIIGDN